VEPVAPVMVQDWVADAEGAEIPSAPAAPAEPSPSAGPRVPQAKGFDGGARPQALTYTAPTVDGDGAVVSAQGGTDLGDGVIDATGGKPGRNDPCPCGSGRKYKRCHGDPARRSTA
jgi:preprotein translocase subunit SecA